jgi:hypothetical protein
MERNGSLARMMFKLGAFSEEIMPGRRSDKKGSFGGHLDEVVRVFEPKPTDKRDRAERRKPPEEDSSVHDRLFESAWRKAREDQESRFSNQ